MHIYWGRHLLFLWRGVESAFRINEDNHPGLPKIPVLAIGYEEAEVILRHISPENPAPTKWGGKMDAPYNIGPNLRYPGWKVRLDVSIANERRTTFNTIGILKGSVEDGIMFKSPPKKS